MIALDLENNDKEGAVKLINEDVLAEIESISEGDKKALPFLTELAQNIPQLAASKQ